ncbi:FAD binding domain protein [Xylariaceae sp. FL0662B]|nr:FAD binding domain protein [Xylariaceae sp. FL0662B]
MVNQEKFHVIIVGGGITGLTLANMLEQVDIEYTLLEAHDEIAPAVGASIGLNANGLRILDQLGCYESVRELGLRELNVAYFRDKNGKPVMTAYPHPAQFLEPRHGYPILFFDRQWFLQILYDRLQSKHRVVLNKRVVGIDHIDGGVQVTTKDGTSFRGTLVVGVDGIHSPTRALMFRLGNQLQPGYFPPDEEERVPCYYQCSFGIADDVPNWVRGDSNIVLGDDKSQLVISGPEGRVYWFLFVRLPEAKYGKNIPKYTKEDEEMFNQKHASLIITENITFGDLVARRLSSTLTPVHEMVYKKWFFKRIFIFGDAAHKPNPISGQGGNGAIESAAEFVNSLTKKRDDRPSGLSGLTDEDIEDIFTQTQAARNARELEILKNSHQEQALNAYENRLKSKLVFNFILPLMNDEARLARLEAKVLDSTVIRKLPVPHRPRMIPFTDELPARPVKNVSSILVRVIFCAGMAVLFRMSLQTMQLSPSNLRIFKPTNTTWVFRSGPSGPFNFEADVPPISLGHNLPSRGYLPYLLSQIVSPLLIYTIEGYRMGNQGTLLSLPSLFTISIQTLGIGRVASLYALITALQAYELPTGRFVHPSVVKALIPALALGYILSAASEFLPILAVKRWSNLTPLTPLLFPVFLTVFRTILERRQRRNITPDKAADTDTDFQNYYKFDDVPYLKSVYILAFFLQAIAHLVALASWYFGSDTSVANVLSLLRLRSELGVLYKHDIIIALAATVLSNLFSIWDLRRLGYVTTRDAIGAALGLVVSQVIFGPGATWAGLWYWRESVIVGLSQQ